MAVSATPTSPAKKQGLKRRSPRGIATNDLVFSAYVGTNDEVFPQVLSLYVPLGATVADVTYGKGVFWRHVPAGAYNLLATDLASGVDCRRLPYESETIDCVVFDPPYMHTPGGTAHVNHQNYEGYYKNNQARSEKNIMRRSWIFTSGRRLRLGACSRTGECISSNARMRSAQISSV